jgi:putative flavoprotein involved in K+ transport
MSVADKQTLVDEREPSSPAHTRERVVVVGGGPAGLAVAAVLRSKGIDSLILDRADEIGASWKAHYDRLHLHTVRWLSNLPGVRIPRRDGKWVSRDDVVRYLKRYAEVQDLRVRLGVSVDSVRRSGPHWRVATSEGFVDASSVVIATGFSNEPIMPEWLGAEDFNGELLHSSRYRNGNTYAGRDVLVVGAGNSGAEIAVDLAESGARKVWLSVRTGPNIMRRDIAGFPTQVLGVLLARVPVPIVDRLAWVTQRLTVGDLSRYGIPRPGRGLYSRVRKDERIPILDVGLIGALKRGEVEGVPSVTAFEGADVVLADGRRLAPDAIIAATGFRRGLGGLVGHLNVLDKKGNPLFHGGATHPDTPGLYFIGFSNPLSGNLRALGIEARRIARTITSSGADPGDDR